MNPRELFSHERSFALSHTRTMPGLSGMTNYYLILERDALPVAMLLFLDTRGSATRPVTPNYL